MEQTDAIRSRLESFRKFDIESNFHELNQRKHLTYKKAAVLIPLFLKEGGIRVLLTRRSDHVSSHKGDVAFPGGKQEPCDVDLVSTALREANEEVGIHAENVEILAVLPARGVGRRMLVTPVVGFLKSSDFRLSIDHTEVETAFDVPLEFFLKDSTDHFYKTLKSGDKEFTLHFFDFKQIQNDEEESFTIYGFTAGVCVKIASIVLDRLPEYKLESKHEKAGIGKYFLTRTVQGHTTLKSQL